VFRCLRCEILDYSQFAIWAALTFDMIMEFYPRTPGLTRHNQTWRVKLVTIVDERPPVLQYREDTGTVFFDDYIVV
jgi:hypothetical protein